ncbi:hypothetical protein BO86DRAFT_399447 [Aspergillus japonicus CBS 114.51]|uniref:Uncharacterized protein n=1 Tax=Aspergillus japonicus CBS 114.51 TaxID=1448312 RepID=A0A8T8X1A8_ASPJA|nr:hypothetical protein BO86DRAFT_399447 [Aspergillus japonicus CBS 114.51]RAH81918.1 hypothetical protein BO86DRAFT_399447 [Aspergillus japonicus CBS 114.51]
MVPPLRVPPLNLNGGKIPEPVTSNTSQSPFAVAAATHPAMIDPAGAKKISVPHVLLALREKAPETVHGWMAVRADLSDSRVREEDLRGYWTVLRF